MIWWLGNCLIMSIVRDNTALAHMRTTRTQVGMRLRLRLIFSPVALQSDKQQLSSEEHNSNCLIYGILMP